MKYLFSILILTFAAAISFGQQYVLENPGGLPGVKITVYHTDTTTTHIGAGTPVTVSSVRSKILVKGEGVDLKMPLDSIVSINSVDPVTLAGAKDTIAQMFTTYSTNKTVALATYSGGGASNITAGKKMVKVTVASGTLTVTTNATTVTLSATTPHSSYTDEAFMLGRVLYLTPAYTIDCTGCTAYVVTVN